MLACRCWQPALPFPEESARMEPTPRKSETEMERTSEPLDPALPECFNPFPFFSNHFEWVFVSRLKASGPMFTVGRRSYIAIHVAGD